MELIAKEVHQKARPDSPSCHYIVVSQGASGIARDARKENVKGLWLYSRNHRVWVEVPMWETEARAIDGSHRFISTDIPSKTKVKPAPHVLLQSFRPVSGIRLTRHRRQGDRQAKASIWPPLGCRSTFILCFHLRLCLSEIISRDDPKP